METQGNRLKKVRQYLDLSQRDMADKLGKVSATWSAYEVGKLPIPADVYMELEKQGFNIDNNSTVTLFAFFTPWCDACAVQVSALNAAKQAYSGKLDIIGVMIGDANLDDAKNYASAHEVNYAIAYGEGTDFFTKALGGINEVPYMAIYDEKGEFSAQYFGLMPEEILMTELEKIF